MPFMSLRATCALVMYIPPPQYHRFTVNVIMEVLKVQSPRGICMAKIRLDPILGEAISP